MSQDSFRVSLPRFILLTTSIFLFVGLGSLIAWATTGRAECARTFFGGPGAVLLVTLALFEFSLARMAFRQFGEGEPLQPAWFLVMLSGGCHLAGALCLSVGASPDTMTAAIYRFGLIVGGPLHMLLLAGGLFFVLRLSRGARIGARLSWCDCGLLLVALTDAYCGASHVAAGLRKGQALAAYDILAASSVPLLVILLIEAILVRRSMSALGAGLIVKCWTSITAGIFLTVLSNIGLWVVAEGLLPAPLAGITWYIRILSATAYALGPAWQIEAVQSACGDVGVTRLSPFASSLAALRLINRTD